VRSSRPWYGWLVILTAVIIVSLAGWHLAACAERLVWHAVKTRLVDEHVLGIRLESTQTHSLTPEQRLRFVELLRRASFEGGNRRSIGPTPSPMFILSFKEGDEVGVGFWGGTRFEVLVYSPDEPALPVLLISPELAEWVRSVLPNS